MTRGVSLGTALFFGLLAATLAVAVLVVRGRDPDLALEVTALTRKLNVDSERARIKFFVRDSEPHARVEILDEGGEPIKTLAADTPLHAGQEATYRWGGHDDSRQTVPPASYYLRVELPGADRSMVWPKRIEVERSSSAPPAAE